MIKILTCRPILLINMVAISYATAEMVMLMRPLFTSKPNRRHQSCSACLYHGNHRKSTTQPVHCYHAWAPTKPLPPLLKIPSTRHIHRSSTYIGYIVEPSIVTLPFRQTKLLTTQYSKTSLRSNLLSRQKHAPQYH